MTEAEGIVAQARAAGIAISDGSYPGQWYLGPHRVSLRETWCGRLKLSGETGYGGVVEGLGDLLLFEADPRAGYRKIERLFR